MKHKELEKKLWRAGRYLKREGSSNSLWIVTLVSIRLNHSPEYT